MTLAYSIMGQIKDLYSLSTVSRSLYSKDLLTSLSTRYALFTTESVCIRNLS